MKIYRLLILCALSFSILLNTAGFSQSVDARVAAGLNAIRAANLRADVTFLASAPLEGRRSLDRGSEVAAQFIAAEFAKAGLKPANGDSYFQDVPLIEYRPDLQQTTITITRNGQQQRFNYYADFFGRSPRETTASGRVVFAGYGITAPEYDYDDYAGLDVRGKIVLIFDHEPQENDPRSVFNGIGNTRHANAQVKLLNAQKRGAIGVLTAAEPNRKHPSAQERIGRVPGIRERFMKSSAQILAESESLIPGFSIGDQMTGLLLALRKPAELQASIDATLKPASFEIPGAEVQIKVVNAMRRSGSSPNVVGMIEGSDPTLKNETIVFSGHYDHDGIRDGVMFPGADDNASGTAGVIELARAFSRNPVKPKRSLLFAVFASEEQGLLGSYYYASHPLRPLATTRVVINFDMIGRNEAPSAQTEGLMEIASDTSNELNLIGTINSPDYRAAVEAANLRVGLALNYKWDKDAALNVYQRSDQFPFSLHDIPAVWWFTGFHPDYHQSTDTADKLNYTKMEKVVRLAYLTGWIFADQKNPPRYQAKSSSNDRR